MDGNELTTNARWISAENYCDGRYRIIQSNRDLYSTNAGSVEMVNTKYDFVGKVMETRVGQTFQGQTQYVHYTNHYDHAGRLKKVEHSLNGAVPVTLASMEYNELGELIKKTLHGETGSGIQELNYRYNIRGWLTQINNPWKSKT